MYSDIKGFWRVTCWVPEGWSIIYTWQNVSLDKCFSGTKVKETINFCWLVNLSCRRSFAQVATELSFRVTVHASWVLTSAKQSADRVLRAQPFTDGTSHFCCKCWLHSLGVTLFEWFWWYLWHRIKFKKCPRIFRPSPWPTVFTTCLVSSGAPQVQKSGVCCKMEWRHVCTHVLWSYLNIFRHIDIFALTSFGYN